MKKRIVDITPAAFACSLGPSCPAVFKVGEESYVVIGKVCEDQEELEGRIGEGEMAVEISAGLLEAAMAARG